MIATRMENAKVVYAHVILVLKDKIAEEKYAQMDAVDTVSVTLMLQAATRLVLAT
jgi:hypothetical protein